MKSWNMQHCIHFIRTDSDLFFVISHFRTCFVIQYFLVGPQNENQSYLRLYNTTTRKKGWVAFLEKGEIWNYKYKAEIVLRRFLSRNIMNTSLANLRWPTRPEPYGGQYLHGIRHSVLFVFWASALALQRVFDFRTYGRTDSMSENNDQPIQPWPWWVKNQYWET